MPAQAFNETFLGAAPVPQTSAPAGSSQPPAPASAPNTQPGVQMADGTANPRADTQTFHAAMPSTPNASTKRPRGVDGFSGERV